MEKARAGDSGDTRPLPRVWQDRADYSLMRFPPGSAYYELNSLADLLPGDLQKALMSLRQDRPLRRLRQRWLLIRSLLDDRPAWQAALQRAYARVTEPQPWPDRWDRCDSLLRLLPKDRVHVFWKLTPAEKARLLRAWREINLLLQTPPAEKWWRRLR